jgi:hypothetical protein
VTILRFLLGQTRLLLLAPGNLKRQGANSILTRILNHRNESLETQYEPDEFYLDVWKDTCMSAVASESHNVCIVDLVGHWKTSQKSNGVGDPNFQHVYPFSHILLHIVRI